MSFLKNPIVAIILVTMLALIGMVFLISSTPLETIFYFFSGPFSNAFTFGNLINRTAPLICTSLGAFIALRSNAFNLGGEGQVYLGATVSGILPVLFPNINLFTILFIALIAPGIIALLSGFLLEKYKISELITTYLISMISINFCNYIISEKFMATNSNILSTPIIPDHLILSGIFANSPINSGIIIALAVTIISSFLLNMTTWGLKFNLSGRNTEFSSIMGIPHGKYRVLGLFLSGGFHGLGGAILVLGINHTAIIDSYMGLGWNGLASGLIAGSNSIFVIFSSLFFAYLDSGANYASILSDTSIELSTIIKGLIFFIITSKLLKNHFVKRGAI